MPKIRLIRHALAPMFVLFTACMSHVSEDAESVRAGMKDTQAGLALVGQGLSALQAGDATGASTVGRGIGMMDGGVAAMHDGLGTMGACRMDECGAMQRMSDSDQALTAMRAGYGMLTDNDPSNDARGMAAIEAARTTMNDAMQGMSTAMTCMGHDGSMMGN